METVSVERTIDAEPAVAIERLQDLEALMDAAGFDEVAVDGDRVTVTKHVAIATLQLTVDVVESDAELAYEQVDGIFEEMLTRYEIEETDEGTHVTATTEFEVAARFAGPLLDATVVKRQRRKELSGQLAYLETGPEAPTAAPRDGAEG